MITSKGNQHLKDIRRARRSKGDIALLEGPHLIGEAVAAGLELRSLLATPEFCGSAAARRLLKVVPQQPLEIAGELLEEFADSDSPRGIVALVRLPRRGPDLLPKAKDGLYLFADGIQDPGNLGALARVAEATGATALCCAKGSVQPNHPRALRASAGSLLRLPVAVSVQPEKLSEHLEGLSPRWVSLETEGGADPYSTPLEGCLVLAVGAEGRGVSKEVAQAVDCRLTLPLKPPVESLNTTVAAAVVLFEWRRRCP